MLRPQVQSNAVLFARGVYGHPPPSGLVPLLTVCAPRCFPATTSSWFHHIHPYPQRRCPCLSQLETARLRVTSRISPIPLGREYYLTDSAQGTFYRTYGSGRWPGLSGSNSNSTRSQLPLPATVAHQNRWDIDRLNRDGGDDEPDHFTRRRRGQHSLVVPHHLRQSRHLR